MTRSLPVLRLVVACVPAAMALVFVRVGLDLFTTVKATVAVLAAVAVSALLLRARAGGWPGPSAARPRVFVVLVVLLLVVLAVAAAAAPSPLRAVVGEPGRHSGFAVWAAALVLSLAAVVVVPADRGRRLVAMTTATCLPLAVYALVQAAGFDPLAWTAVEGGPQVFATLGNADYLSAWLGMALPLALAAALDDAWSYNRRLWAGGALMAGWLAALLTGSFQGPVAGALGTVVVLGATVSVPSWRRRRLAGAGVVVLVGAAVAVGLVAVEGSPAAVLASAERSVETRLPLWETAVGLAADQPVVGVGPGHFGDHWFRRRPVEVVPTTTAEFGAGLGRPVDDAHAVPLHVAATAGLPAAALWVAAQGSALFVAARVLARLEGAARIRLAGLVGATSGAVVVQLVSVDVAPVTVTAWVLVGATAGLAAAAAGGGMNAVPAVVAQPRRARRPVFTGAIAVAAVACSVLVAVPLAADIIAGRARATEREHPRTADERWRTAAALAPWERRYPAGRAAFLAEQRRFREAVDAQAEAVRRAPRDRAAAVDLARLTAAAQGPAAAIDPYARALTVDPTTPALLAEAAVNALRAGDVEWSVGYLRQAARAAPDDPRIIELLQTASAALEEQPSG